MCSSAALYTRYQPRIVRCSDGCPTRPDPLAMGLSTPPLNPPPPAHFRTLSPATFNAAVCGVSAYSTLSNESGAPFSSYTWCSPAHEVRCHNVAVAIRCPPNEHVLTTVLLRAASVVDILLIFCDMRSSSTHHPDEIRPLSSVPTIPPVFPDRDTFFLAGSVDAGGAR